MDTNRNLAVVMVGIALTVFVALGGEGGIVATIGDRSYCRTNTWNGCSMFGVGRDTEILKWTPPKNEISSAIYVARHYVRYGRRSSVQLDYYYEPLGEDTSTGKSWRLNFNQFPPFIEDRIDMEDISVSLSNMGIRVLPFKVTNPKSKSPLYCVLVEFMHNGEFCFAVYVNVNTGQASLDFYELVNDGWMLIASESRYPYLTPDECKIQSRVYVKYFKKHGNDDTRPPDFSTGKVGSK